MWGAWYPHPTADHSRDDLRINPCTCGSGDPIDSTPREFTSPRVRTGARSQSPARQSVELLTVFRHHFRTATVSRMQSVSF